MAVATVRRGDSGGVVFHAVKIILAASERGESLSAFADDAEQLITQVVYRFDDWSPKLELFARADMAREESAAHDLAKAFAMDFIRRGQHKALESLENHSLRRAREGAEWAVNAAREVLGQASPGVVSHHSRLTSPLPSGR